MISVVLNLSFCVSVPLFNNLEKYCFPPTVDDYEVRSYVAQTWHSWGLEHIMVKNLG